MEGMLPNNPSNSSNLNNPITGRVCPASFRTLANSGFEQSSWPIHIDHCFARIILDLVVGIDTPRMQKIKSPAYQNMSKDQLEKSIDLSKQIIEAKVDLVELNNKSLALRSKDTDSGKKKRTTAAPTKSGTISSKRKSTFTLEHVSQVNDGPPIKKHSSSMEISPFFTKSSKLTEAEHITKSLLQDSGSHLALPEDLKPWLKKIALSQKSPFQKKVLEALCQVPRGKYTTYNAISNHLSSSPRAVGNALRNNPFAPDVPCHRVLATGGGLGGFGGSWGRKGEAGLNDDKKRKLLREEGVKFDGKGKVVGNPWIGFT
jgi:O-6-methylguanine DNA methyltransferase